MELHKVRDVHVSFAMVLSHPNNEMSQTALS